MRTENSATPGTKKSYSELLRDPLWQKKRLSVLDRDKFKCCLCGDDRTSLNIHHKIYIPDSLPWEYDNETLLTLCQCCHAFVEINKKIQGFRIEDLKAVYIRIPNTQINGRLYRLDETILLYLFNMDNKIITSYNISGTSKELCEFLK